MSVIGSSILAGASGSAAGGDKVYVDDVFSTYLYDGNNSSQSINNGIDLAGEGGLVWIKGRAPTGWQHILVDTERGATKHISTNDTAAEQAAPNTVPSFSSTGFATGSDNQVSYSSETAGFASWTFRKAPGFFDVVTWSGNATNRTISHNLGSVPGMIIVKNITAGYNWAVYHRSVGTSKLAFLNQPAEFDAKSYITTIWNNTSPTSTHFTVGTGGMVNASGDNYVAYVFAHDDAQFGTDEDESIIKCGSYTGNGGTQEINLGFEAQWLLIKDSSSATNWFMVNNMMIDKSVVADESSVEVDNSYGFDGFKSTGFAVKSNNNNFNGSGHAYVYMAIRRPNKPPELATEVFDDIIYTGTGAQRDISFSPAYADLIWIKNRLWLSGHSLTDRLRGETRRVQTNENYSSNYPSGSAPSFDSQGLFSIGTNNETNNPGAGYNSYVSWIFKRAPGFFDIVAYTGTGSARTINHNLEAVPSVVLIKGTDTTYNWYWQHYALGANTWLQLNNQEAGAGNGGVFNSTLPTSSVFSVGSLAGSNGSGSKYIAYLFGDLPGISKAGTYTGTGNAINVDCGFTNGARFVLIKRTDGSGNVGDWYLWDTARGISSGTDPYLRPNVYEADVTNTDYIDPLSTGFTVTSSASAELNASGGTYIFLAIA